LVEITATPLGNLIVAGGTELLAFAFEDDFVGVTLQVQEKVNVQNSEMIFVGYGIVAPEYQWNDYEGIDVTGKTVVMLVNDPGFATEDPELFNGRAMTYYGRWTYKYEEAARQGAAGALIIHDTGPAGYPWDVVESSWTGPQFALVAADDNMGRVAVEGWISNQTARAVLEGRMGATASSSAPTCVSHTHTCVARDGAFRYEVTPRAGVPARRPHAYARS